MLDDESIWYILQELEKKVGANNSSDEDSIDFRVGAADKLLAALQAAIASSVVGFTDEEFAIVDVSIKTYVLQSVPITNSAIICLNGLRLRAGASNDYSVSGATVTLTNNPILTVGDLLTVNYARQ